MSENQRLDNQDASGKVLSRYFVCDAYRYVATQVYIGKTPHKNHVDIFDHT